MIQVTNNARRTSGSVTNKRTGTSSDSKEDSEQHWGSWHRSRHYSLDVIQHPIRARMCGFGDKDRRPLAPAAVAKMTIRREDNSIVDVDDIDVAFFVVTVDLWSADGKQEMNLVLHPSSTDRYIPTNVSKQPRRRGNGPPSSTPEQQSTQASLHALPPPATAYAHAQHQSAYPGYVQPPPPPGPPASAPDSATPPYPVPHMHPPYPPYPDHGLWGYPPYPPYPVYPGYPLPSIHSFHRTDSSQGSQQGYWSTENTTRTDANGSISTSTIPTSTPLESAQNYPDQGAAGPPPQAYPGYGIPPPPVDGAPLYAAQPYGPAYGYAYPPPPSSAPLSQTPATVTLTGPPGSSASSLYPTNQRPPLATPGSSSSTQNSSPGSSTVPESSDDTPSAAVPIPRATYTRTLVGPLSANAARLNDEHRKPGIFFLFQDLSIRTEGTFKLRLRLMNIGAHPAPDPGANRVMTGSAPILAQTFTESFTVYSAKRFPGVPDTTALSIAFGNQGQKLPLRNRHGSRNAGRRRRRGDSDDSEDESDGL